MEYAVLKTSKCRKAFILWNGYFHFLAFFSELISLVYVLYWYMNNNILLDELAQQKSAFGFRQKACKALSLKLN
jgi:hypothetical protein